MSSLEQPGPTRDRWRTCVSRDRIGDAWPRIARRLRRRWPRLTTQDVMYPDGSAEYLARMIQLRYGISNREALEQVYEFEYEL